MHCFPASKQSRLDEVLAIINELFTSLKEISCFPEKLVLSDGVKYLQYYANVYVGRLLIFNVGILINCYKSKNSFYLNLNHSFTLGPK